MHSSNAEYWDTNINYGRKGVLYATGALNLALEILVEFQERNVIEGNPHGGNRKVMKPQKSLLHV
jgi:hypothetical protein